MTFEFQEPKINIQVAHEPSILMDEGLVDPNVETGKRKIPVTYLGEEYNRIMRESQREWVCIIDSDIFFAMRAFYPVLQNAIRATQDQNVGLISCYTNETKCSEQRAPRVLEYVKEKTGSKKYMHRVTLRQWQEFGNWIWKENKYGLKQSKNKRLGGFLMLTSKTAWQRAGGFSTIPSQWGIDQDYCSRIDKAGMNIVIATGLFVAHLRDRKIGSPIDGEYTSRELHRYKK